MSEERLLPGIKETLHNEKRALFPRHIILNVYVPKNISSKYVDMGKL